MNVFSYPHTYSNKLFRANFGPLDDESGVDTHIRDFILRIPDGVAELFIPIFTQSVSHWTLLHFNFFDHRWKHYNSLTNANTINACKASALGKEIGIIEKASH
ncbi:hypothetical protein MKX03_027965 [Papaver bracteatum]|nr:hypothetical protein MKX03_027965 [Papaver bracteatum]